MNIALFGFIRSLGFGGLIGAGTFGTAYCLIVQHFVSGVGLKEFLIVGALLGAGLCQLIERYINTILSPVVRTLNYYAKTAEVAILRRTGAMRSELAEYLQERNSLHYFDVNSLPQEEPKMIPSSLDLPNQGAAPDVNRLKGDRLR